MSRWLPRILSEITTGVCEKDPPPDMKVGKSDLKAPNLGLDCSFCCWVAWPRLT